MWRVLFAYLAAVTVTYVTAAAAHTQSVMSHLEDMDVPFTFADRVAATLHDIGGMATSFLPMVAVGLAIALPLAAAIMRVLPGWRQVGYALAGGAAMLTIHLALSLALDITPVAGARTTVGLTIQALCGALGGGVFRVTLPHRPRQATS
jgi:hypothetical protein